MKQYTLGQLRSARGAGKHATSGSTASSSSAPQDVLVGKWFLSYLEPEHKVEWQGCVLGKPSNEQYLVQTYSWVDGGPYDQRLVPLAEMARWTFYDTDEEMREAYDRIAQRERRRP